MLQNYGHLNEENFEKLLIKQRLGCVASGEMDDELKFYFYAKHVTNSTQIKTLNVIIMEL